MTYTKFILRLTVVGPVENVPLTIEEHVKCPTQELTAQTVRVESFLISATTKKSPEINNIAQLLANKFELKEGEEINNIEIVPVQASRTQPKNPNTRQAMRVVARKGGKTS